MILCGDPVGGRRPPPSTRVAHWLIIPHTDVACLIRRRPPLGPPAPEASEPAAVARSPCATRAMADVVESAREQASGLAFDPVMEKVAEYASSVDASFENTFGPIHALTKGMPLMVPSVALAIATGYLAFVLIVPALFRATGFCVKLKPVMRVYNLFMVVLSAYMGTKSVMLARESNDTVFCVPLATGKAGQEMAQLVWIFTFSKVVEFLDTVFMILEGRMRQVSFLHVYHHVSILSYWFTISWVMPGSDAYFSLAGNSYIHVLMYGYYLLASFGYSPWWKYYVRLPLPLSAAAGPPRSDGRARPLCTPRALSDTSSPAAFVADGRSPSAKSSSSAASAPSPFMLAISTRGPATSRRSSPRCCCGTCSPSSSSSRISSSQARAGGRAPRGRPRRSSSKNVPARNDRRHSAPDHPVGYAVPT